MKVLRAIVALMLLASPAVEARVLIVSQRIQPATAPGFSGDLYGRQVMLFRSVLETFGADYVWVPLTSTNAANLARGRHVWMRGTPGFYNETFDGTIVWGFNGRAVNRTGTVAAESLTNSLEDYFPRVPQLLMVNAEAGFGDTNDPKQLMNDKASSPRCTTGISSGSPAQALGPYLTGSNIPLSIPMVYTGQYILNSTPPAGGTRPIIGAAIYNYITRTIQTTTECSWCDSAVVAARPDTVYMWERMWDHWGGAKPQVFVSVGGAGAATDSLTAGDCSGSPLGSGECFAQGEGEIFLMLAGLARLDSMTGGKVFSKRNLPIRVAVTIDGGFVHNARRHPVGYFQPDSSVLKATIDSLASLNIPAVLGVNLDSVASYPNEKSWWAKWPRLRYTPQTWRGVADTTRNYGNTSTTMVVDAWGRYRNRAAFGDSSGVGRDTSLHALLYASLARCDSIFRQDRVSRVALPPADDWSPKGLSGASNRPPMDSVLFAAKRAGYKGIRINVQNRDGDPGYLQANPKGFVREQGAYRDARGQPFKLLGHSGFPIAGAITTHTTFGDSTPGAPSDSGGLGLIHAELARAWKQIAVDRDRDADAFPIANANVTARRWSDVDYSSHDILYDFRRGAILRYCVNDFSGVPNGPPARLGWWVLKSLKHQFDVVNKLAGRTVIEFAYPEDITADQLRGR